MLGLVQGYLVHTGQQFAAVRLVLAEKHHGSRGEERAPKGSTAECGGRGGHRQYGMSHEYRDAAAGRPDGQTNVHRLRRTLRLRAALKNR